MYRFGSVDEAYIKKNMLQWDDEMWEAWSCRDLATMWRIVKLVSRKNAWTPSKGTMDAREQPASMGNRNEGFPLGRQPLFHREMGDGGQNHIIMGYSQEAG